MPYENDLAELNHLELFSAERMAESDGRITGIATRVKMCGGVNVNE